MKSWKIAFVILAALAAGFMTFGQESTLYFTNQTIIVHQDDLSIKSVEYNEGGIVEQARIEYVNDTLYTTNQMAIGIDEAGEPIYDDGEGNVGEFVILTNDVVREVSVPYTVTNAPTWICNVEFSIKRGTLWELNNFPVMINRFQTYLTVMIDPAVVEATFGANAAAGLQFAASNGAYKPAGQIKDGFLMLAAAKLEDNE